LPKVESFYSAGENEISEEFLTKGYVVLDAADRVALDEIRDTVASFVASHIDVTMSENPGQFLDTIHERIPVDNLNDLRLATYRALNNESWFRPTYFQLGRPYIQDLVGNELAMQNRINFSVQMPNDTSSLLDIHADVFAGETPYQIVQWTPLVDVSGSKSMFFLERSKSDEISSRISEFSDVGMSGLFEAVRKDLEWLNVSYGQMVIFSPICLHGNILNSENTTRWSLNCRFTGLFTPYDSAEKSLGSFYLPITPRPITRVGMSYRHPAGFEE
jgi:sporadic carbohydrate cluster 2OG-Fe(II) oxygenase